MRSSSNRHFRHRVGEPHHSPAWYAALPKSCALNARAEIEIQPKKVTSFQCIAGLMVKLCIYYSGACSSGGGTLSKPSSRFVSSAREFLCRDMYCPWKPA